MKVLQLCHRVPYPANDGGNIAMLGMTGALLSQGVQLKMLALNTLKHWVKPEDLPEKFTSAFGFESVRIDTGIRTIDAFLNLFSTESYNIKRFYSQEFESKLIEILNREQYEVILLESLFMAPYIQAARKFSKAKIVLRSHNIEHVIWERLASHEKKLFKKFYLTLLAKRLRNYEIQILSSLDALIPITEEDKRFFSGHAPSLPMQTAPVGINMDQYPDQANESEPIRLFHIGSMDWRPNAEGVSWFLKEAWQKIHNKFPSLNLYLAGRNFPKELKERNDAGVIFQGEVNNAHAYMGGKQVMIVPLKSGGGMRVKIIEGMALGKTIISTTIGAEGIRYTDGKNILIADTPAEFLSAIEKCMSDKKFCFEIGLEARRLASENYSNERIGKQVVRFLESNVL